MNTNEILQMIGTLKDTGFKHIDVSHEGSHILLSNAEFAGTNLLPIQSLGQSVQQVQAVPQSTAQQVQSVPQEAARQQTAQQVQAEEVVADSKAQLQEVAEPILGGHLVESPIVGTFYTAAGPDTGDFVSVGSKVNKGDVLCIIEAMKLMNEIEADISGEIVEILVANEAGVEYGQPLFRIV